MCVYNASNNTLLFILRVWLHLLPCSHCFLFSPSNPDITTWRSSVCSYVRIMCVYEEQKYNRRRGECFPGAWKWCSWHPHENGSSCLRTSTRAAGSQPASLQSKQSFDDKLDHEIRVPFFMLLISFSKSNSHPLGARAWSPSPATRLLSKVWACATE